MPDDQHSGLSGTGIGAVTEYLRGEGIAHEVIDHEETLSAAAEAAATQRPPERVAKTVVLHDQGVYMLAVFDHWGMMPHWTDTEAYNKWAAGARAFGGSSGRCSASGKSPRIVFDHPGEDTVPTSIFVCDTGGMVVICAGTSGFNATVDLRYLWMRQKRFQGSHFANDERRERVQRAGAGGQDRPVPGRDVHVRRDPASATS